ncbi:MAG: hypothetical protein M3Z25_23195, partial [Actinomycetota bacterium]|nr:hypothetical protein [Actinomycetota bacterium]
MAGAERGACGGVPGRPGDELAAPDPTRRTGALRRFFALEARQIALPHGVSVAAAGSEGTLGASLVL